MRLAILSTVPLLLATAALLSATGRSTAPEGTWSVAGRPDGRLQLTLRWGARNWGGPIDRAALRGLTDRELAAAAPTPVELRIERESGVLELRGTFQGGSGTGRFRFVPDRAFAAELGSLGIEGGGRATDDDLLAFALNGPTAATIRDLAGLGLGLTVRNLVEMGIHGATGDYVRSMRQAGLSDVRTAADVIDLRVHEVTPEYVREMQALGLRGLSAREYGEMRIHDVTPEYVRELEGLGFRGLSQRQLVALGVHDVTPAFIRQVRQAGFRDLTPEALVQMKVNGVRPAPAPGGR